MTGRSLSTEDWLNGCRHPTWQSFETYSHVLPFHAQAANSELEKMLFGLGSLTISTQNKNGPPIRSCPSLLKIIWLGGRDSNPDRRIQSPQSYR